jgi:hypothetical protein
MSVTDVIIHNNNDNNNNNNNETCKARRLWLAAMAALLSREQTCVRARFMIENTRT